MTNVCDYNLYIRKKTKSSYRNHLLTVENKTYTIVFIFDSSISDLANMTTF